MNLRRFLPSLIAVAVLVPLAIWALLTIRLQTELLPLLPQNLPSVQGMALFQSAFSSAQEVTLVVPKPAADAVESLRARLVKLPDVEAVTVIGTTKPEAMLKSVAWLLVNLPPEKFAAMQMRFNDEQIAGRLAAVQDTLSGAINAEDVARVQIDPLGLLEFVGQPPSLEAPTQAIAVLLVRAKQTLRTFEDCQRFVDEIREAATPHLDPLPASGERRPDPLSLSKGEGQGEGSSVASAIYITGRPAFVAETSRQMKHDMFMMLGVATVLVGCAFWLFYRSLRALLWILLLQILAVLTGVIAARLLFGELNVLSIGFAAILLGVGMDYCILVYHFHAGASPDDQRRWRILRRAIWLSSATTAASFGVLYFSGFPGLQQLAVLIATGLLATAFFATELEPLFLSRKRPQSPGWVERGSDWLAAFVEKKRRLIISVVLLSVVIVVVAVPLYRGFRFYDADVKRLRPPDSEAYRGLDLLLQNRQAQEQFEVIVTGKSLVELGERAQRVAANGALLPREDFLTANRESWSASKASNVRAAFQRNDFEDDWARTTVLLLEALDAWKAGREDFHEARAFLSNTMRTTDGAWMALLRVPVSDSMPATWQRVAQVEPSALPANWSFMTTDLGQQARRDFRRLSLWMLAAVVGLCWVAHRSLRLVGLNMVALLISVTGLFVLLFATKTSMTLLSLLSIPLLVGMIIDISLHLVLALEEHDGDLRATFHHMAAPVCLTGLTSMIGFGVPMLTQQPALQNLGFVMDLGILSAVTTGLVVLPAIYATTHRRPGYSQMLYRAFWFDIGERLTRLLGRTGAQRLGRWVGTVYRIAHPRTAKALQQNLSLLQAGGVNGATVRQTFRNYGETLADYFILGTRPRAEVLAMAEPPVGFAQTREIIAEGKGALLVTTHLSLFEFGSLFTEEIGRPPLVVSLPEPSAELGRWRAAYRQRWGAETLEIGDDSFSFVEITRQIAKGRCVAMLADRPYGANFVLADFPNGQVPFSTGPVWLSLLARTAMVAVTTVRMPSGLYRIEAHPPIRSQWLNGAREETIKHYTLELAAIFRKVICEYPDQWYQFVPLSPQR